LKISKFGPHGVASIASSKSRYRSTSAALVFRAANGNFISFIMKSNGAARGMRGNGYGLSLYKVNETGRVAVKVLDRRGSELATLIDLGGYAGLAAAVAADATLSPLLTMRLSGSIPNTQAYSSSLTDYTYFTGGS